MGKGTQVVLSDELNTRLDRQAEEHGVSRSAIIRWAVREWLKTNEQNIGISRHAHTETINEQPSDYAVIS